MTVNDVLKQAPPPIDGRSQMQSELQPPIDAMAADQPVAEPATFDGYLADGQPRRVHPLDEPFDPNHPPQALDGAALGALATTPAFSFRSVTFAVGIAAALLVVAWLRGAVGSNGRPAAEPVAAVVRQTAPIAPAVGAAQPNQAAPALGTPAAPAAGLSPITNARPDTAVTASRAAAGAESPAVAEVAPADVSKLAAAPASPPTAPSDDPSLNQPANGGSSGGAPMNSAGNPISPIAVIPLGARPGQATTQRRGRSLQPAPVQVYEPRAQNYLDRAALSRRLGDKAAATADYRHAVDDYNLAVTHGEDPYTAQAGLQTAREGLRQIGVH